jgi:Rne/Rng family ribonuclease
LENAVEATAPGEEILIRRETGNWWQLSGAADAFEGALEPEAPLPKGGRLWIERTRACWTVDVDSSGFADDRLSLNKSAAVEAARQLRLRNASGPILIDFPRMNDTKAETAVIADLRAAFAEDPAALRFNDRFDRLGFYAFSRQRTGTELVRQHPAGKTG